MNETVRQLLSGIVAGLLTAATATITALQETPLREVSDGQWVVIVLGGAVAALTGWRTLLAQSPRQHT